MEHPILEMKNITKEFPGVKALNNVSFRVARGEIHCLVGENGAGKSTLMKVLSGVYPYGEYTGEIVIAGQAQKFQGISDSEKAESWATFSAVCYIVKIQKNPPLSRDKPPLSRVTDGTY